MEYNRTYCLIVFITFLVLHILVGYEHQGLAQIQMYIKHASNIIPFAHGNNEFKTNNVNNNSYGDNGDMKAWTILTTVNDGYFDFFQNWILFYNKLRLSNPLIVIAEDDIVFKKLHELNEKKVFKLVRSWRVSLPHSSVMYETKEYNKLVSGRPSYVLRYLENSKNILYADIDSVWLQDPFPFFNGSFDMWLQVDEKPDYLCTGFMAIRSNNMSIKFMKLWETSFANRSNLNQPVFNSVYKQSKGIRIKPLETSLFPSGKLYFEEFSDFQRKHVVIVHNNYIIGHDKKLERFKKFKLWFAN